MKMLEDEKKVNKIICLKGCLKNAKKQSHLQAKKHVQKHVAESSLASKDQD